jgi:hypothetical protein
MKEQHMKTAIEMAGQIDAVTKVLLDRKEPQGMSHETFVWFLERLVELARADEREQGQKWFDAVTAQHKAEILAEREACAKVCDEEYARFKHPWNGSRKCAELIRARGAIRPAAAT